MNFEDKDEITVQLPTSRKRARDEEASKTSPDEETIDDLEEVHEERESVEVRSHKKYRISIEEYSKIAKARGGELLSKTTGNTFDLLEWKCSFGHRWTAPGHRIRYQGAWCPTCSKSISVAEYICKNILQSIFDTPFPKERPSWLRETSNSGHLELDGVSHDLKIAFEYQGKHHYQDIPGWTFQLSLDERKARDALKRKICNEKGYKLIDIPYTVANAKLQEYIVCECTS